MSTESSTATPAAEPISAIEAQGDATGQQTPPPAEAAGEQATPAQADAGSGSVEDVYDQAFSQFLDGEPDAAGSPGEQTDAGQNGGEGGQQPAADPEAAAPDKSAAPAPPQLDDTQVQLLKRNHLTPEMIAHWTPDQQQQFLTNAAKREADQTRSFQELRAKIGQKGDEKGGEGEGDQAGQQAGGGAEAPPASELAQQAQQVVDDLVDVYGEEMKPLGDLTGKLVGVVDQLQQRVNTAESASSTKDQLIVEMTIDSGVRDLMGDYPSLGKSDVRNKVVERFTQAWRDPNNPHRTGQGPLLQRVRSALKDAAAAEFNNTESAAQVALANKTKDRLRNQPQPGAGRGRKAELTEDDVYNSAFDKHLKPAL